MSIFGTGLSAYNLGQAAGLWGGSTPNPGTPAPATAPRRPFGGPTGTSGSGAPVSTGAFLGNLWDRASGMAQRAARGMQAAVTPPTQPARAQAQRQPARPEGPKGMPPAMTNISDRAGNWRLHAGALQERDQMMSRYQNQMDAQNQSIADTLRGNAERVGQNKDRMARVMAAQAGQAGQIAQANATAMAAQANAQAMMASERMKADRINQILSHIGNDRYSF